MSPWRVTWNTPDGIEAGITAPDATVQPRTEYVASLMDSLGADFGGSWRADWDYANRVVKVRLREPDEHEHKWSCWEAADEWAPEPWDGCSCRCGAKRRREDAAHEHDWGVPLNDQGASPSCRGCGIRYDFGGGDEVGEPAPDTEVRLT